MYRHATRASSIALVVVGIAILVSTVLRGGGPLATGLLLGVLFIAAGAGRLYVSQAHHPEDDR